MNNALIVGIGALLVGGVGGYITGSSGGGDTSDSTNIPSGKRERVVLESSVSKRDGRSLSLDQIMREPGKTRRLQSLMDLYADLDPALFASEAEKLSSLPFSDRILAAALLFSRWAEVAPEEAMAHAQGMGREGFFVRPTVVSSWAATDPVGAAKYYSENPGEFGGGGRGPGGNTAGQIAGEWAKQDPLAALEWAQGLDGNESSSAVQGIFRELAQTDPAKAAEMAVGLEGEQLTEAYSSIAREWASKDWSSAEAWISGLPADQRDSAMSEAIQGLAGSDPVTASLQVASISDGEARSDAIGSVARNWSEDDPASAADWLATQDSSELGRSMDNIMRNWVQQDQTAALEFVNSQAEGELRDTSAREYVMANRGGDVQETLQLAESIGDDEMRGDAVAASAARWMREDKDAAMNYIQETQYLTDDQAERIIRRVEEGGVRDRGGRGGRGR